MDHTTAGIQTSQLPGEFRQSRRLPHDKGTRVELLVMAVAVLIVWQVDRSLEAGARAGFRVQEQELTL